MMIVTEMHGCARAAPTGRAVWMGPIFAAAEAPTAA